MGRGDPTGVSCFASCGQTFGSGGDLREKTLLRVLLPGTEVVVWLLVLLKCFQFTIYIYMALHVDSMRMYGYAELNSINGCYKLVKNPQNEFGWLLSNNYATYPFHNCSC